MEKMGAILWIVVIAVMVAFVFLLRKERGGEKQYDERQLALRAEGYKIGYFVTLFAAALALFLQELELIPAASASLALYVALLAGVAAFAVFCIVKDVFFSLGNKGNYYLVLCGFIVVLDGALAVSRIVDGSILENGVPTFSSCNSLLMALLFLVILVALLVRRYAGEGDE